MALIAAAVAGAGTVVGLGLYPVAAPGAPAPGPEPSPPVAPTLPEAAPAVDPALVLPPLPDGGLRGGSAGPAVAALEARLTELHYDPGPVDGQFDGATTFAVYAFEKVLGMEPTGEVDALLWAALRHGADPEPLLREGGDRRVEIDLPRQLLFVYDGGALRLIAHTSTGSGGRYCNDGRCGVAVTPAGAHRFLWRVNGWRTSRLGRLYNPVYFTTYGIAVHGFHNVPTHPASHGCVRLPMHVAEYFPSLVSRGDPVYVFDGVTPVEPLDQPPGDTTESDTETADTSGEAGEPDGRLDGDPPAPVTSTSAPTLLS